MKLKLNNFILNMMKIHENSLNKLYFYNVTSEWVNLWGMQK
jgi:hypothetical protein